MRYFDELSMLVRCDDIEGVRNAFEGGEAAAYLDDEDGRSRTLLHHAAEHSSVEMVRLLLDMGAEVNPKSLWGKSPLHVAVDNRRPEVVSLLLAKGADVSSKGHYNDTPLHRAAWNSDAESVALLLAAGADVGVRNQLGHTPDQKVCRIFGGEAAKVFEAHKMKAALQYALRPQPPAGSESLQQPPRNFGTPEAPSNQAPRRRIRL